MNVQHTNHVDASEPDEAGSYEYYYEYDLYRFTEGRTCFVARSYADEPGAAHFLRVEEAGENRQLTYRDLSSPLFIAAQAHLLAEGKIALSWLSGSGNGYELIPNTEAEGNRISE